MNIKGFFDIDTPEEAEKIVRSASFPVDCEALSHVAELYFNAGNDYKALTLIIDFFPQCKTAVWFPHDLEDYVLFVEGLYTAMYRKKDIPRTLRAASLLADAYKGQNDAKLLMLNYELIELCGNPASNSTFFLITKEAITAAVNIIEGAVKELPSEDVVLLICRMLMYIPGCCHDGKFAISIAERICMFYTVASDAQLHIIRMFLPELERGFAFAYKALSQIDEEDSAYLQGLAKCREILFCDDTPKPIRGREVFQLPRNDSAFVKYLSMIDEKQKLWGDLMLAWQTEDWSNLPELTRRQERLVDYFTALDPDDQTYGEPEHSLVIVSLLTAWRNIDFEYTYKKLKPVIEKIETFERDISFSTNALNSMSTIYYDLSDIYTILGDMQKTYDCYIQFMKYGNMYFKRICFEHDFAYFIERVKDEYFYYHDVYSQVMTLLSEQDFPVGELYVELCKRKNLVYLGEMWRRGYRNITDVNRLLENDFTLDDVCASIPKDAVLIDFMYCRRWFMDDDNEDGSMKDKHNAYCEAFLLDSSGNVTRHHIGKATILADKLVAGTGENMAKELTEQLLQGISNASRIVVCTDGDLNSVSFASLPFRDGFVTDYYAVRNIGSVYDIVYPRHRKPLKNALIFSAPAFGKAENNKSDMWVELIGSELEGELIQKTIKSSKYIDLCCLSGVDATLYALKESLRASTYSIVHFSTHGCLKKDAVGLVAADANNKHANAILWDNDLDRFALHETSLIIYALCFGARQTDKFNDSLSGFVKFSLLSGANAVIAPLFPIQDLSSTVLLNEFYKAYTSTTFAQPETALQEAVCRVRNISKKELRDEYNIEADKEYPFSASEHWTPWVCYSAEAWESD